MSTRSHIPATLIALIAATSASGQAPQQIVAPEPVATYVDPAAVPLGTGSGGTSGEDWAAAGGQRIVRNVTAATIVPVLPDPAKATGAAVIVAPGGGYMMLSIDNEGYAVARWLADHVIAAFLLKYRLRTTPHDIPGFFAAMDKMMRPAPGTQPAAGAGTPPRNVAFEPAVEDAKVAVRLIRSRAAQYGIDPARIGMVGFSAGAATTLGAGLAADKAERPDFIAPIYGPMWARTIPADAPPLFTALAADDTLFASGGVGLIDSYRTAKRPFELHVYESGGHGFGMRTQNKTSDLWIDEFYKWMLSRNLLTRTN